MVSTEQIKVLLIEDDHFISGMYNKKLLAEQFTVVLAFDGEEGIAKAQTEHPDIILLDIMLPKVDGWQVLQAIKSNPACKNIPVVLLTNLGTEEDIERGLQLGAVDYLIKAHFVPSEVVKKIRTILSHA